MNGLLQFLNRLGLARVAAMAVVAVLMLGFFAFLIMRTSAPQLAPLYTGLSFEDSAAITRELQGMSTPFELRNEGETILVPRDQITTIRMALAENGLPTKGQVGYEIFDQQNTLGATSFVQNINNVRALEGELARTISSLARIKSARVHLVLPERELFRRERKDPTASIVLSVRGELSGGEIRAIQHLVASAIEGMTPNKVSIVDDAGRLLASGGGSDDAGLIASEGEERAQAIEQRMRDRIEEMLSNVVGAGRARVQVAVELDLNRSTKTSETFDPDGQVVRSTQSRENANSAKGADSGAVSVANELPGATATAGDGSGSSSEQGSATEETVNYEISKTTETAVTEAGAIKRLSVAVVVDGTYTDDGQGNVTYAPRTADQLAQITSLVRSAIGFVETRGDQVDVVNMQFAEPPTAQGPGTSGPGLFDFTRDDLINWAQMGVTLIIALALILFVMRPLIRKVLAPETTTLALAADARTTGSGAPGEATAANYDPETGQEIRAPQPASWLGDARHLGESQLQTLKSVGSLVEENPRQAAMIVRDWLNNAA